jgi:hypothetical protein
MKSQKAPVLSGHLCVSNRNDIQILIHCLEFPFSGTSIELWKSAGAKYQEYKALGWNPAVYFKTQRGHVGFDINSDNIDEIMSM